MNEYGADVFVLASEIGRPRIWLSLALR